jgi:hypothetical protein
MNAASNIGTDSARRVVFLCYICFHRPGECLHGRTKNNFSINTLALSDANVESALRGIDVMQVRIFLSFHRVNPRKLSRI